MLKDKGNVQRPFLIKHILTIMQPCVWGMASNSLCRLPAEDSASFNAAALMSPSTALAFVKASCAMGANSSATAFCPGAVAVAANRGPCGVKGLEFRV